MDMCYPEGADWSCEYTSEELEAMREDSAKLKKMQLSEARAWHTLNSLTAGAIALCAVTIRPCAGRRGVGTWLTAPVAGAAWPSLWSFCGCQVSYCGCSGASEVALPGPVGEILEVKVDGEVIDPARYRVDNGNLLVSVDPDLHWPISQNAALPLTERGTFGITYERGAKNELILSAVGTLAVEYYKACTKSKSCRLPRGVQNVSRGGVSYEIDTELFPNGYTRIPEVDSVIRIYNPNTLVSRPRVLSPDGIRPRYMGGIR